MMIKTIAVVFAFFLPVFATPLHLLAGSVVPGQYIITFHDNVIDSAIQDHFTWLKEKIPSVFPRTKLQVQKASADGEFEAEGFLDDLFGVMYKYALPGFNGYSARLPRFIVDAIKVLPIVAHVEEDKIMTIFEAQDKAPSWGLTRISYRDLPPKTVHNYVYPDTAGTGVTAYVIDTGIFWKHPEFQGRAIFGKSFTKDGPNDGNGHGTHVAGTIGSKSYGVAKNVTLVAVKVLDARGSGTTSDVIAGIEWAAKDATAKAEKSKSKNLKAVANMSLGGGASAALDRAVKAAIARGLVFGVAAGNSARDACLLSPARVAEAVTVAASDKYDNLASFSERGKCVDIIAPGVDITSTWNNGKVNTISGTSMATPHVVGVISLALAEGNFTKPAEVHDYIKAVSSKDRITGSLRGAPNNLLYNHVEDGAFPDQEPKEPQPQPEPEPEPPKEGECPIPQCFFDPECTSCCVDCFLKNASL